MSAPNLPSPLDKPDSRSPQPSPPEGGEGARAVSRVAIIAGSLGRSRGARRVARQQRLGRRGDVRCRIRLSPTRKVLMPTLARRARSAGRKMPLSPTSTRSRGTRGARRSLTASAVSNVLRSRLLMPTRRDLAAARARARPRRAPRSARPCPRRTRPPRRPRGRVVERRHDDQDAVGAERARLGDLVGLVHEILAQRRQRRAARAAARCAGSPWNEGASVSTDRQVAPPAA